MRLSYTVALGNKSNRPGFFTPRNGSSELSNLTMSPSLLRPQGRLTPSEALQLAQRAPEILRSNPKAISASPLQSLFSTPETADLWTIYENLLLSCLRTGNDEAAHQCLERLVTRFGNNNERLMALKGLVKEAEASSQQDLDNVLVGYDTQLRENGANIVSLLKHSTEYKVLIIQPIAKRRAALLRSLGKIPESIAALNSLLDFSPTDAEAWAEVGDLYLSQGLYPQAIFAMEEVLVLMPNAWNVSKPHRFLSQSGQY